MKESPAAAFLVAFAFVLFGFASHAKASSTAQTITLDGRLFSSPTSDAPLLDASVVINVKILSADKSCVLYEENQTRDTTATGGRFTLQVGSVIGDSKRAPGSPANSMTTVFQNSSPILGAGGSCIGSVYSPSPGDHRYMRITVVPSATMTPEILGPDTVVDSVPTALVAETLQGYSPSRFLLLGNDVTQARVENVFSATNYPRLTDLLAGASTDYVRVSNGSATIPSRSGAPGAPAVGQIWYDTASNSLQFYSSGGVQTVGTSGGSVTSVALTLPPIFTVAGSPVTSSGTLSAGLAAQAAGTIFAGPATGGSAAPAFRAIASTDLPVDAYDTRYARLGGNTLGAAVSLGTNDGFALSFRTNNAVRMTITSSGGVGIGTATPSVALDVAGAVRVGTDSAACSAGLAGSIRYNNAALEFCDGGSWKALAAASGAISSFGGLTATAQLLAIGTSGSAPSWSTSGVDTHVLNLPLASAPGVTAGLVSNSDLAGKLSNALPSGNIWIGNSSGVAINVIPSGDVSFSNAGVAAVSRLRGVALDPVLPNGAGQVLRYDASGAGKWTPGFLSMADIRSTATGSATIFPAANCPLNQTMVWSSLTDSFVCQNIQIASSQIVYSSASANLVFAGPASGAVAPPTFRGLVAADLPAGGYDSTYFKQNGNSFGATASLGTNDSNSLALRTNGLARTTILASGAVGIGTASPGASLEVYATGAQSAVLLPRDSTTNRPTGVNGMIRYNTSTQAMEMYASGGWSALATTANVATSASQWVTSGANISYSAGNVGVGAPALANYGLAVKTNAIIGDPTSTTYDATPALSVVGPIASVASPINMNVYDTTPMAIGVGGGIGLMGNDGATDRTFASIHGGKENATSGNYAGYFSIYTRPQGGSLTERARIDSFGNLGVGTSSPSAALEVAASGTNSAILLPRASLASRPTGVNGMIRYNTTSNKLEAFSSGSWIDFAMGSGVASQWTTNGSNLYYNTGNIGIGITSPSAAIHVSRTSVAEVLLESSSGSSYLSLAGGAPNYIQSNRALTIYTQSPNPLRLGANNNESVAITANGWVGVGTLSPSSAFEVYATGASSALLVPRADTASRPSGVNGMIRYNTTLQAMEIFAGGAWTSLGASAAATSPAGSSGQLQFNNSGTFGASASLTWDNANTRLGVGTSSPSQRMHVAGGGLRIAGTSATNPGNLMIDDGVTEFTGNSFQIQKDAAAYWALKSVTTGNDLAMFVDNTVGRGLYIKNTTGNVGIGTTTPAAQLDVRGSSTSQPAMYIRGDTSAYWPQVSIWFADAASGGRTYSIGNGGATGNFAIADQSAAQARLTIDSSGRLGFGTSTPTVGTISEFFGTGPAQSSILLPRDSTANRPASPVNGMIRYNTDLQKLETFQSGAWASLGAQGTVTTLSASSPLSITNPTTTPSLSISQAGAASNGFLSSSDWNLFSSKLDSRAYQAAGISYGGDGGPMIYSTVNASGTSNGAAMMSFHRPNAYAVNFGLDTDNQLKVGGWSMGANAYTIWHSGNLNPSSYQTALGYTPVNRAGDTMTGNLTMPAGMQIGNGIAQGFYGDSTNFAIRAYNTTASDIYFQTYNGSSTNMIIKNNGKVGINTTDPFEALTVLGDGVNTAKINISNPDYVNGSSGSGVMMGPGAKSGNTYGRIQAYQAGNSSVSSLILNGNGGNVGIGTTSPNATLNIVGGAGPVRMRNSAFTQDWVIGPDSGNVFVTYNWAGTGVYIANGNTTWSSNSDARVKKEIRPIEDSLTKLNQITGVTYLYKKDADSAPRHAGVIAQDVQKVLPEAITEKDGILGVKYTEVIPLVINAVKDLFALWSADHQTLDEVKQELANVKSVNVELQATVSELRADAEKKEQQLLNLEIRLKRLEQSAK